MSAKLVFQPPEAQPPGQHCPAVLGVPCSLEKAPLSFWVLPLWGCHQFQLSE